MAVKAVGPTDPVPVYLKPAYGQPPRVWHLVNLDQATTVFYDDNPTVTATSNQLLPLGGATFDGSTDVWCCTVGGPAVLVQTGLRGQRGWSAGPVQSATSIQQAGVPPKIPGLKSKVTLGNNAQLPTVWFTFPAASTIWGAGLSYSVASNASFPAGTTQFYARLFTGSGLDLTRQVELALGSPSSQIAGGADMPIGGVPVAKNDTLKLDVNNGNPVPSSGGVMHASAIVFYSTP